MHYEIGGQRFMEMLIFGGGGGGGGFHVGVWEQMFVMLILEEGFHED